MLVNEHVEDRGFPMKFHSFRKSLSHKLRSRTCEKILELFLHFEKSLSKQIDISRIVVVDVKVAGIGSIQCNKFSLVIIQEKAMKRQNNYDSLRLIKSHIIETDVYCK